MVIWKQKELKALVKGACLLGSGGGGTYSSGMNFAKNFKSDDNNKYYDSAEVEVINVSEVEDNKIGVVVAFMGSPVKMEKYIYPDPVINAIKKIEEDFNKDKSTRKKFTVDYIIPAEVGALNSLVACTTAAKLKIPVVDVDGAGRAIPTLQLTTFSVSGTSINPTILATDAKKDLEPDKISDSFDNQNNYSVSLSVSDGTNPKSAHNIESLARPVLGLPEFDQVAGISLWIMNGKEMKDNITIRGTLTKAKDVGEAIQKSQKYFDLNCIKTALESEPLSYPTEILFFGKLVSGAISTGGGFDNGKILFNAISFENIKNRNIDYIENLPNDEFKDKLTIIFQNESLLLWNDKKTAPIVMAPDIISYIIFKKNKILDTQLVYSNGDIMNMDTKQLKEDFKGANIFILGIEALYQLKNTDEEISEIIKNQIKIFSKNNQNKYHGFQQDNNEKFSLPKNYQTILNDLGYYGKYIQFNKNHEK